MAKFSYNNIVTLFCVFLVAWMMSEAVGQEICHDVIPAPGGGQCDPQSCKDQCAAKWGAAAAGLCVNSFPNLFSCNCSWPCGVKGRKLRLV
ncbi:hypothetical protein V6N12_045531 [Hibiscus sabdariffa]|uniref:Uncharacterized protein n=1 Tax=Hibiscus sabdariffa TaxID=183260 RepID=A0ABR2G328_9ROSI